MGTSSSLTRPSLRIVITGHVDHGKSTLIGRMLHDTGSLPDGKLEELRAVSERRGVPLEWSFVLDSFQAERDQAVTIDTTQIRLRAGQRDIIIIDAPGHREFLKNMISGAAQADAAVLVVDVVEGMRSQTRRHAYLLHLLGLRQVVAAVNKMDTVDFDAGRFQDTAAAVTGYLDGIGLTASAIVPLSARDGGNIASRSPHTPWYEGPTLLEALNRMEPQPPAVDRPLRFPIQDVYRRDGRRIYVGRVESGSLRTGDTLLFSPSGRTARVAGFESWGAPPPDEVQAGQVAGFTLDEPIFAERGDIASHPDSPPPLTDVFGVTLFWFGGQPLVAGNSYTLKLATAQAPVTVQSVERVIDTETLTARTGGPVHRNEIADVVLRAGRMLAPDSHVHQPATGRCVLLDGYDTAGGGIISTENYPDRRRPVASAPGGLFPVDHLLTRGARAARNGHGGAVVWMTGLSGAGKSTLAMRTEQRLFAMGYQTYVLDGDNIRRGLNSDLDFSPDGRAENLRRIGEAAVLFADAGMVVISAFIAPYRASRAQARAAAEATGCLFLEVYVKASLDTCIRRDPKGLYHKAQTGSLPGFTGISSPYEPPEAADLVLDTDTDGIDLCVDRLLSLIAERTRPAPGPVPAIP